jgi:hypothetical protein
MKTDTIKKVVLGLLILVVAYVWYGNLQLFTSPQASNSNQSESSTLTEQVLGGASSPKLAFQSPKVNPFTKPKKTAATQSSSLAQSRPRVKPQPSTPRPSSAFHLVGTLTQANIDFAAVADTQGKQVLLQRGDSLNGWVTKRIRQDLVIFAQDKFRDTLQLITIELQ